MNEDEPFSRRFADQYESISSTRKVGNRIINTLAAVAATAAGVNYFIVSHEQRPLYVGGVFIGAIAIKATGSLINKHLEKFEAEMLGAELQAHIKEDSDE